MDDAFGLRVIELEIDSEDRSKLRLGLYNETTVPARLHSRDQSRKVRLRHVGASTRDDFKRNYEVTLADESFLGMNQFRLSGESTDPTGLRSLLSYRLFEKVGFPVPKIEPVWLQVNGSLLGLYLLVEPIEKAFFDQRSLAVQSLYKLKLNRATFEEEYLRFPERAYSLKEGPFGYEPLKDLIRQIHHPDWQSCNNHWSRSIDQQSVIDYMAVSLLIRNRDGINNNFFMFQSERTAPFKILPWDMDLALKSIILDNGFSQDFDRWRTNALFTRFLDCYQSQVLARVDELIDSDLSLDEVITPLLEELSSKIQQAYNVDPVFSQRNRSSVIVHYQSEFERWYLQIQNHRD
ncbi:CotH kinase family protein [Pseudobacteriovorax antillogorgiicola]|uniref:CotH kinase family protein n=1 Tax=Pseudobacteriovorax antillogorgiicola TaxID=1513793 RepID=UPI0013566EAE|nr:CotH kinase family protein [Pseudobacteriovorax antillogorgiicola]